ncbi:MAG: adenosine kinase [Rikenellaceae bacterium]
MKKVLTIGNALLDSLITLPNDDILSQFNLQKGTMSLVDQTTISAVLEATKEFPIDSAVGGSAGNCARALAHLGGKVAFVGKVGSDSAADVYSSSLKQLDITSRLLTTSECPTGRCISLVSPDGERTMTTYLGAALCLLAEDITPELFEGHEIIFIEGYLVQNESLLRRIFEVAHDLDMIVSIDLASYNVVEQSRELLTEMIESGAHIVFANEAEAEAYTLNADPMSAAEIIAERVDVAVVKVGPKGSITISGDEVVEVGATDHVRRDTTGAGDYFAGAFLRGFCDGETLVRSAQMGSIAGGAIIEVVGALLPDEGWESVKADIKVVLK